MSMDSLARAFAIYIHKLWNYKKAKTKVRPLAPLDSSACFLKLLTLMQLSSFIPWAGPNVHAELCNGAGYQYSF